MTDKKVKEMESEDILKDDLQQIIKEGENIIDSESHNTPDEEVASKCDINKEVFSNNPNMKWFIVYVRTGQELKAKEQLDHKIKMEKKEKDFGAVLIPSEEVVEVVKGKKRTSKRKFFPGYMLVQMIMNQENWHFVKSTPRVVGFIGDSNNPLPISEAEVLKITNKTADTKIKPKLKVSFEEGETVRVTEGPFTNFTGIVEEVKPDKSKLKVLVSIFGRSTPVELEFVQVEKI
jgi:transcriptional antiterminator NusG